MTRNDSFDAVGSFCVQKRSISNNNLKKVTQQNIRMSTSNLRQSSLNSSFPVIKTYKQDAMKLLIHRLNSKFRTYFDTLKHHRGSNFPSRSQKSSDTNPPEPSKVTKGPRKLRCSRKSISTLQKAIGYCKDIESSFENLTQNSPNTNRLKRSNDLRMSIQALGAQSSQNGNVLRGFG